MALLVVIGLSLSPMGGELAPGEAQAAFDKNTAALTIGDLGNDAAAQATPAWRFWEALRGRRAKPSTPTPTPDACDDTNKWQQYPNGWWYCLDNEIWNASPNKPNTPIAHP